RRAGVRRCPRTPTASSTRRTTRTRSWASPRPRSRPSARWPCAPRCTPRRSPTSTTSPTRTGRPTTRRPCPSTSGTSPRLAVPADRPRKVIRGKRFGAAVEWTVALHADQVRKGTDVPYVAHLLEVAAIVLHDGGSEAEVIAALLHDAIEDAGVKP